MPKKNRIGKRAVSTPYWTERWRRLFDAGSPLVLPWSSRANEPVRKASHGTPIPLQPPRRPMSTYAKSPKFLINCSPTC